MKWLLIFSACVLAATNAGAQTSESDDPRVRAAAAFAAAERAFADEDYPNALQLFRSAYSAMPADTVRFNIAVCLERLGRFREAGAEYDAVTASATLAEDVRARARAEAERVRQRLGTLIVAGAPDGAAIQIDGDDLCRLPCRIQLDPGRHEVVASSGGVTDRGVVVIARSETTHMTLRAVQVLERRGAGLLTWLGVSVAAIGTGGTLWFGLRARKLHDDYVANPSVETREDGLLARNVANVSLAVAVAGAVAVTLDLAVFARRTRVRVTPTSNTVGAVVGVQF
jgi:hypothetical protein